MSEKNAAVAIYNTHVEAEKAVKELQKSGFDMKKLRNNNEERETDDTTAV